jgi:glucokinase
MNVIAADIGGTHISVATINWLEGKATVQGKFVAEVNTALASDQLITEWSKVIQKAAQNIQDFRLGISMPGPYDYENGISLIETQGKMRSLFGLSVKNLLAEGLGISPQKIRFLNDAESFLKGEALAGAGKGLSSLLGITLGTGLGSAIQIHEVTKDAKLWTSPFRDGIAEDYLGTGWFIKKIREGYGLEISGVKDLLDKGFDQGICQEVFREFGNTLGEFLLPYVIRLQTQKVILGGKISKSGDLFIPQTKTYLAKNGVRLPIEVSALGEDAALIGASSTFLTLP